VIKHRTGGRVTAISTAVVFGDPAAVAARLGKYHFHTISPAHFNF